LLKDIIQQEEKMEQLFRQNKINYDLKLKPNTAIVYSKQSSRRKPVIDYKVKIKNLERDIYLTKENYNDTKAKNEILKSELDEMRKGVMIRKDQVSKIYEDFKKQEINYKEEKEKVEFELDKRKIDFLKEVDKKTNDLADKNNNMIRKIKENDEKITNILAKKKYINHEKVKLEEREHNIMEFWHKKNEEFLRGNQDKINKLNENNDSDKVLDLISGEKINEFREIVNKLNKADSDEDDLIKITRLLDYFINKTNEVIYIK
jgi:hypothetical protein